VQGNQIAQQGASRGGYRGGVPLHKWLTGHAVEAKLRAQPKYVVWRDSVVVPSQKSGGRISVRKSGLPEADPGAFIAHKWRLEAT
jgi:hypothetical protein